MRRFLGVGLLLVCTAATNAQIGEPEAAQTTTVTVTAEGFDREDAVKQALRRALEQGAGVQISAHSNVENFTLVRDTIYSRAAGVVRDYEILKSNELPGGTWEVTIRATVRPSAIAETWGEVQNVLDQIGRPRIMVWIDEQIDGALQKQSLVESRIEELFVKAGFDLVAREAIKGIERREKRDAERNEDAAKLARLAKEAGAHLLIRGYAHADRAGLEDLYGTPVAFYNCDVQAKVFSTDSGRLLASESIPVTRRGVRSRKEYSPQAARTALTEATFPREGRREPALAVRLFESVMEQWSTAITAGRDVVLEVSGLDFRTYANVKRALGELRGVTSIDGDFTEGTGTFRLKSKSDAQTLAERLLEEPFEDWLEVVDLKPNRIQAKARAGENS